jgi:hypothetical protein
MVFFAILGGYVLTSVFFFKYPNLIHKRRQLKFKCRHISHRGGESVMVININVNIAEHDMQSDVLYYAKANRECSIKTVSDVRPFLKLCRTPFKIKAPKENKKSIWSAHLVMSFFFRRSWRKL